MKFGLSFLPDSRPSDKSAATYFQEALALSKIADEAGFVCIKMTEHYLHPYGGYCPSPLHFLAAVASITKQVRLMTGCILPAFHHPIQIAAETAMLDALSQGRLDVGFARAYLPYEFEAFHIDMDSSRQRFVETIEATHRLWTEKNVSVEGPFFDFKNANSLPLPTQTPHPPVWCAAVNARESFSWIGEKGFGLLVTPPIGGLEKLIEHLQVYRESFEAFHPQKTPSIALSMPLLLHENHNEAIKQSDAYLKYYLDVWGEAVHRWSHTHSSDYPGYQWVAKLISSNTPEKMRNEHQAIVGTPRFAREKIEALSAVLGVDYFLWQVDFGAQPFEVSKKSIELLIEEMKQ